MVAGGGRDLFDWHNTNKPPGEIAGYTCFMSSQSFGGKLTYEFDPDPSKIGWTMQANIQTAMTRGGQVSYSAGRMIGPLMIAGVLRSRWDLMDLGNFVALHMQEAQLEGKAMRFVYPERDIDFSMYIQNINEVGLDSAEGEMCAYQITAAVTQDHSTFNYADLSSLGHIPPGVEWIDVKRAAEIAEKRFPGITSGAGSTQGASQPAPSESSEGSSPTFFSSGATILDRNFEELPPEEENVLGSDPPNIRITR